MKTNTAASDRPLLEPLEARTLFAALPALVDSVQFLGDGKEVTAVQLHFSEPLDPASASITRAYKLQGDFNAGQDGVTIPGTIGGLFGPIGGKDGGRVTLKLSAAAYDAATQTSTLTLKTPLARMTALKVIRVQGNGADAVLTQSLQKIDGNRNRSPGGDAVLKYKTIAGQTIRYKEDDGDSVRFRWQGPGRISVLVGRAKTSGVFAFLNSNNPSQSSVVSTVTKGKNGDGIIRFDRLATSGVTNQDLTPNPLFSITLVT